jgi:hypothetical protein
MTAIDYGMNSAEDVHDALMHVARRVGYPEVQTAADFDVVHVIADAVDGMLHPADIIGPGEIRQMAGGVTRKTLMTWRERPDFPAPVKSLGIGDLFDRRAVQAWLTSIHRGPAEWENE